MKEGWEYKKLGEIGSFKRGKGIQKSDFVEDGLPCIHYGQLHTSFGVAAYDHLTQISKASYEQSIIAKTGDLIFALTSEDVEGSCKATAWLGDHDIAVSSDAAIYSHSLVAKYVSYYFRSKEFYRQKEKYARGFKVTHIKTADVATFEIPVPSEFEQDRIVAELDLLTGIIDKQKAQLKELDTLAQSIFYEMFGSVDYNRKNFVVKSLSEVFQLITDGTHQTPQYTDDTTNGFKFLSAKDVVSGVIDWTKIKYIPESLHNELYRRLAPRRGDILLCKNGTTGICALVETDDVFDIYVSLALLRTEKDYNRKYLVYAINNPSTKSQFDDSLKGVGVPNLHLGEIKKTKILVPPLSLQESFAQKIESIESQKAAINRSIAETRKLFDYTMDKYFG